MTGRLALANYLLAFLGAAVTYAMMVNDAYHAHHWIHVVTLTPLFPYFVAAGLAFRHRLRPMSGKVVTGIILLSAASGWPLFWFFYVLPESRPQTKVLIKIVLPVCQGMLAIVAGVLMELLGGSKCYHSDVPKY